MPSALASLPLKQVRVTDPFWRRWQETVRDTTLEIEYQQCSQTGRIENFARAARGEKGSFQGRYYNDSDVYKWIEAASHTIAALGPSAAIERRLAEAIEKVAAAQMADGYLDTYFQLQHPELRWKSIAAMHEMYCAGHLIEAAVSHFQATGDRTLLDVAERLADHISGVFGPQARLGFCGHEELELALVTLERVLDRPEYRALSAWMVEQRGKRPSPFEPEMTDPECLKLAPWMPRMLMRDGVYTGEYVQDHLPLSEQEDVVGHAVRAMYLFAGAADASDDPKVFEALERLWTRLTERRMYVTGGIGSSGENEGFTVDYDLPNRNAYAETCAACGLIFWAQRMLNRTGDSEYADVMELALYNGALAGISLDGSRFFYDNPLESLGDHHRSGWFDCACCPPNIARLLASMSRCLVGQDGNHFYVHIQAASESTIEIAGTKVKVFVHSSYPWDGDFEIEIRTPTPVIFGLHVRIPGWCPNLEIHAPDSYPDASYEGGYAVIEREWNDGDRLKFSAQLQPTWLRSSPKVMANTGRVALKRGPLVYCLEEADLGTQVSRFIVDRSTEPVVEFEPSLLGGVTSLTVDGWIEAGEPDSLYYGADQRTAEPRRAKFVPYFAWDNRTPGSMQVWVRDSAESPSSRI